MDIPTARDASPGYNLVIENAKRHFKCGNMLSELGEYGPATSHMVLSTEESIKAMILLSIIHGPEMPSSSIHPFLNNHRSRHAAGFQLSLMDFLTKTISLIESLNESFHGDMGQEYQHAREEEFAALASELNKIADAAPGENEITDRLLWWGQAESLKQRGLYVDFYNHAWTSPSSATDQEFSQVKHIAQGAIEQTEKIARSLASVSKEEYKQLQLFLNQLLQNAGRTRASNPPEALRQ